MNRIVLANYKARLQKVKTTNKMYCQVIYLDDSLNRMNWMKINSESTFLSQLKDYVNKFSDVIDDLRDNYLDKIRYIDEEYSEGITYEESAALHKALNHLPSWQDFILDYKGADDSFVYIILNCLLDNKLIPSYESLRKLHSLINQQTIPFSKKKIVEKYESFCKLESSGLEKADLSTLSNYVGWIEIPSGNDDTVKPIENREDIRNLLKCDLQNSSNRANYITSLCRGAGWCIGEMGFAERYTKYGSIFFYIENGGPKLCIRFDRNNIVEITGIANSKTNAYAYVDHLLDFYETHSNLKRAFDSFDASRSYHCIDVKGAKSAQSLYRQYNGDEAENNIMQNFNTAFDYLSHSTIAKMSTNENFIDRVKQKLLSFDTHNHQASYFEYNINRFPFLKKDKDIVDHAINLCIKAVQNVYMNNYPDVSNIMQNVDPSKLNNSFKSSLMKSPRLRSLVFDSYMFLLNKSETSAQHKSLFLNISKMLSGSGAYTLFKDKAKEKLVSFLGEGKLEQFDYIRNDFNIGSIDNFDESVFDKIVSKASELLISNMDLFNNLNNFLNGKLKKEPLFSRIKEEAKIYAENKIKDCIIQKNLEQMGNLFSIYPELKTNEQILSILVNNSISWIVDDHYTFDTVDSMFDNYLTEKNTYLNILKSSFNNAVLRAEYILYQTRNFKTLKNLNDRFQGYICKNNDFYKLIKEEAVKLLTLNEQNNFNELNDATNNQLMKDITEIREEVFLNLTDYILKSFSTLDIEKIKLYNKLTGGLVSANKDELLENSLKMALDNVIRNYFTIDIILERKKPNPLMFVGQIDYFYNGLISSNNVIQTLANSIFKELSRKPKDEYIEESLSLLNDIFEDLTIDEDEEDDQMQHAVRVSLAIQALDKEDYESLKSIVEEDPTVPQNENLYKTAVYKVRNYLEGYTTDSKEVRNYKITLLNKIFYGKILTHPTIIKVMSRIQKSGDEFKETQVVSPKKPASPSVSSPPEVKQPVVNPNDELFDGDDLNMANNWYQRKIFSDKSE